MEPNYFYLQNGQEIGPISSANLRVLAERGQIHSGDLVRAEHETEWRPFTAVAPNASETAIKLTISLPTGSSVVALGHHVLAFIRPPLARAKSRLAPVYARMMDSFDQILSSVPQGVPVIARASTQMRKNRMFAYPAICLTLLILPIAIGVCALRPLPPEEALARILERQTNLIFDEGIAGRATSDSDVICSAYVPARRNACIRFISYRSSGEINSLVQQMLKEAGRVKFMDMRTHLLDSGPDYALLRVESLRFRQTIASFASALRTHGLSNGLAVVILVPILGWLEPLDLCKKTGVLTIHMTRVEGQWYYSVPKWE